MSKKQSINILSNCAQCTKRIAKTTPPLSCYICQLVYHPRCTKLTKSDALNNISLNIPWMCRTCTCDIFPFGNIPPPPNKIYPTTVKQKQKCGSCTKSTGSSPSQPLVPGVKKPVTLNVSKVNLDAQPVFLTPFQVTIAPPET